MGLIDADEGQIRYLTKKRIGYLPEQRCILKDLSPWQQGLFVGKLKGMPQDQVEAANEHWLQVFNLYAYRHQPIGRLSKGNQQKIQLMMALLESPDILILDEPFSGLDVFNAMELAQLLVTLRRNGTGLLVSSHRYELMDQIATDVLILQDGQTLLQGSLRQLYAKKTQLTVRLSDDPYAAYRQEKGVVHVSSTGNQTNYICGNRVQTRQLIGKILPDLGHARMQVSVQSLEELVRETLPR